MENVSVRSTRIHEAKLGMHNLGGSLNAHEKAIVNKVLSQYGIIKSDHPSNEQQADTTEPSLDVPQPRPEILFPRLGGPVEPADAAVINAADRSKLPFPIRARKLFAGLMGR